MKVRPIIKGALTLVPGMAPLLAEDGGATASASYCYGVWLKHLVMLWANGMRSMPRTMVELGPGESLGTGFAALLSGVGRYTALDVVAHSDTASNLHVFDELVELFWRRAARPVGGWPDYDDYLDGKLFPSHILTDEVLAATLAAPRIARIREAIVHAADAGLPNAQAEIAVAYIAPWSDACVIEPDSVDLIVSHAVLGQVDDLERTYRALHAWLKPGAMMSHQIGFEFHGYDGRWNGYWACPEPLWKIIRGKRRFGINRVPCSEHLKLMAEQGFEIVCQLALRNENGTPRSQLSSRWRGLSDEDLLCSELFVQARKLILS